MAVTARDRNFYHCGGGDDVTRGFQRKVSVTTGSVTCTDGSVTRGVAGTSQRGWQDQ